jgi:PAS domain S-box-containing protein
MDNGKERPPFSGEGSPEAPHVDTQGGRQSRGIPAAGQVEGASYSPTGGPGVMHWQEGTITKPGLDDRSDVFFAAIEMTRMPIILTDPNLPDNPIVFANRAFQDLTGYREDEIIGRNCRFLQGAQTSHDSVRELREAVAERRAISMEILNYKRDGTPFWNGVFIGPVYDNEGHLLYFFASQLDVTRRRTTEQAFRQAQKMESIGQLTGGIAHDFNNLLSVLASGIEVLGMSRQGSSDAKTLDSMRRAIDRGATLTQQLLAFARQQPLQPETRSINRLISGFESVLRRAGPSGIEFEFNLDPQAGSAVVDAARFESALLNLVVNARDAMPEGGRLSIDTAQLMLQEGEVPGLAPGPYVCTSVTDTGTGMTPETVQRAFEPFYTTKETGKGTGLGLSQVYGFIKQSGGEVVIQSTLGEGTTIAIYLPAVTSQDREVAHGESETVLIVEDEPDLLDVASALFMSMGYEVTTAASGQEAMGVLASRDVDILFTDIVMPNGVNGLELAEYTRENYPNIKVMLASGYPQPALKLDQYRLGDFTFVSKPYRLSDLARGLRSVN